ncbi:unnamed protein product [Symbiodinium sp. CCMP2592]|nr:unnamed protein product [Symbiodinium sp. CCMP2592]
MGCCPSSSDSWPDDGDLMLSMPPGKMLTEVHAVGACEDDIDPEDPTTDDLVIRTSRPLFEGTNSLAFATIRPSGIHSCVRLECGYNNTCTHLMPETGDFMPGLFLQASASVRVLTLATGGSVTTFQCPNTVRIGFVGFGCEPGTILMPPVFMV